MGTPSMPPAPKLPPPAPSMLDPTVMFARLRERQKALSASGRESTILTGPAATAAKLGG